MSPLEFCGGKIKSRKYDSRIFLFSVGWGGAGENIKIITLVLKWKLDFFEWK